MPNILEQLLYGLGQTVSSEKNQPAKVLQNIIQNAQSLGSSFQAGQQGQPLPQSTQDPTQQYAFEAASKELKKRASAEAQSLPTQALAQHVQSSPVNPDNQQNTTPQNTNVPQQNPMGNPTINQQNPTGLLSALLGTGGVNYDKNNNTYTMGNVGLLPALLTGFSGKSAQEFQMNKIAGLQKLTGTEPIQPEQQMQMGAQRYTAQANALTLEVKDAGDQIQNLLKEQSAALAHPFQTGAFGSDYIQQIHQALQSQYERQRNAQQRLQQLSLGNVGKGDLQQKIQGIKEGSMATNPQTGEKIIFKGGQWKPNK